MPMDERKQKVLEAIIMDYIATAEPVGSRTIARKYGLGVSPATIRNEMADLEELGYIEQPHTSAGRIPSDLGYRYYVDCLMEKETLDRAEEEYIRQRFSKKVEEIETVFKKATEVLSEISSYTALILGPHWTKKTFDFIQLILLEPGTVLMVVVINQRLVQHWILNVPENIGVQDLERVSRVLNDKLKGYTLDEVKRDTLIDIYQELSGYKSLVRYILDAVEHLSCSGGHNKVYMGGTLNILNQPEFKDVDKLKNLLSVLEQENIVKEIMEASPYQGVSIKIGGENKHDGITDCSVITATYHVEGITGTVGIIGPTRMSYSRVVSLVECVAQNLSEVLFKMLK